MKKLLILTSALFLLLAFAGFGMAQDVSKGESAFKADLEKAIPPDRIKTVADLHKVWMDVQAGKSKAILIDVRTHPEFDAGHIEGHQSGHAGPCIYASRNDFRMPMPNTGSGAERNIVPLISPP